MRMVGRFECLFRVRFYYENRCFCGVSVGPMKSLSEKVPCRSLSSIHIDYNQPIVGGLSVHSTPATLSDNVFLAGGSKE